VPEIVRSLPRIAALASRLTGSGSREVRITVTAASNGLDVALADGGARPPPAQIAAVGSGGGWGSIVRLSFGSEPVFIGAQPTVTFGRARVVLPPGAFIQASAEAETAIVEVVTAAVGKAKHIADLFCGVGTLTFHLARQARVLAIDSDAPAIAALQAGSREATGFKPVTARRRDLFSDPLSPRELDAFDAVVFDPPRAGAAAQAAALARSKVRTIAAVSCNPATLARDVRMLIDGGYRLEAVTPIDQFIYSAHVEAVAVLRR
jgi:23S rRNA (uracil1939-C5)-methyltransferase